MANSRLARNETIPSSANMAVDEGLRSFMLGVYNKMGLGLLVSAVLALTAGGVEPVRNLIFGTSLHLVVSFAPIAILFGSSFFMKNPSPKATSIVYWSVVCMLGISMGSLTIIYGGRPDGLALVAKAFFITAAAFGGLSLWGYVTQKDLTGFGSFMIMGLFGLIIASIVNLFLQSSMMDFVISCIGVLVFAGLVAYDTQRLKFTYYQLGGDQTSLAIATNYGALSLYLDFINLFTFILRLMSSSRD